MKENTGHKQGGYMIDKIIGFIGAGNMGSAMIGGIVQPCPMKRLQNAVIFYFLL